MTDGYLSKDRERLNRMQRERRAQLVRIDYHPDADVLPLIEAKRPRYGPEATNSATLNAIVREWATLTGIKNCRIDAPETSSGEKSRPELFGDSRANDSGPGGSSGPVLRARVQVPAPNQRVPCGAKRRRDGQPCQALSVPGKRRCKWHGGCSTGPKTAEGKARALSNLRRGTPKAKD